MHWRIACGITWRRALIYRLPITNVITVPKLLQPDLVNGIMKKNAKVWIQKKRIHVRIVERGMMLATVCGIMSRSVHKRQQLQNQLISHVVLQLWTLPSKALKNLIIHQLHHAWPNHPSLHHPSLHHLYPHLHRPNSTWWRLWNNSWSRTKRYKPSS